MSHWRHTAIDALRGLPGVNVFALLLAGRRLRQLPGYLAETRRAYRAALDRRIPARMPIEVFKCAGPVTIRIGEHGHCGSTIHLLVMSMVAMLRPRRVFEFGTHTGGTTALVAMNTADDAEIFTLDLPPSGEVPAGATDLPHIAAARAALGKAFRGTPWDGGKIKQLLGNSAHFDYGPYHESIDLVIVDASHSPQFVRNDSLHAFRMIRPGGVILWHDYESMRSAYGVTAFCNRLRERHGCPVYRLGAPGDDTRYAWLQVDAQCQQTLAGLAADPARF